MVFSRCAQCLFFPTPNESWTRLTREHISTVFLSIWDELMHRQLWAWALSWCIVSYLHNIVSDYISGWRGGLSWVTMVFQGTSKPMWLYWSKCHGGFSRSCLWGLKSHAHPTGFPSLGLYTLRFHHTFWNFSQYYALSRVKNWNVINCNMINI